MCDTYIHTYIHQATTGNATLASEVAGKLARANADAQLGRYDIHGEHPTLMKKKSLHETNRGWGAAGPETENSDKPGSRTRGVVYPDPEKDLM